MKKQPVKDDKDSPNRVDRGGSLYKAKFMHVFYRNGSGASFCYDNWGFRIVRNKPSEKR